MNGDMSVDQYIGGKGIAIGTRDRLDACPLGFDVRFVDACDLPSLRAANPAWRSIPLAPIEILDPTGALTAITDVSIDYVIDWTILSNAGRAVQRLDATARVLRPGGVLVLPVCDSRYVHADAEMETIFTGLDDMAAWLQPQADTTIAPIEGIGRWPLARFAMVMGALSMKHAPNLQLEHVRRYGRYNLALLRRCSDAPIKEHSILLCEGDCYVLDGPFIRHIASVSTLDRLRAAGVPLI